MSVFILCLFFFLAPSFAASSPAQPPTSSLIVLKNPDLAFELKAVEVSQKALSQKQLQSINRDATAGFADEAKRIYTLLILDPAGQIPLIDYARNLVEGMPIEDKKVLSFKETSVQSLPAVTYVFEGKAQGQNIHYEVTIISFKGLFYQLVCFQVLKPNQAPKDLDAFKPKLTILTDLAPKLQKRFAQPDFGQVWLKENGFFKSLPFRFQMRLPSDFDALLEEEASSVYSGALALFVSQKTMARYFILGTLEPLSPDLSLQMLKISLGSAKISTTPASSTTAPLIFKGEDKTVYHVRAQSKNGVGLIFVAVNQEPESDLDYFIARNFQWLDDKAIQALREKLASPACRSIVLGPGVKFSGSQIHFFDAGFSWVPSKTDVLDVTFNEQGVEGYLQIHLTNITKRTFTTLTLEEDQFQNNQEYHQAVLDSVEGANVVTKTSSADFLISQVTFADQRRKVYVTTRNLGSQYLKTITYSDLPLSTKDLIEGFEFKPVKPYERAEGRFIHKRLDFSLRDAKADEKLEVITAEDVQPLGEFIKFRSKSATHYLCAINSPLMDADLALDLFLRETQTSVPVSAQSETKEDFETLKIERKTYKMEFSGKTEMLVQRSFRRGTTFFAVFSLSPKPADTLKDLDLRF